MWSLQMTHRQSRSNDLTLRPRWAQLKTEETELRRILNDVEAEAAAINPEPSAISLLGGAETRTTLTDISERLLQGKTALQQYMGLVDTGVRPTRAEQRAIADDTQALCAADKLQRLEEEG